MGLCVSEPGLELCERVCVQLGGVEESLGVLIGLGIGFVVCGCDWTGVSDLFEASLMQFMGRCGSQWGLKDVQISLEVFCGGFRAILVKLERKNRFGVQRMCLMLWW